MEILERNWAWISSNIWTSISLATIVFVLGWCAARFFYERQLSLLKERLDTFKDQNPEKRRSLSQNEKATDFKYPDFGRHGSNVLGTLTDHVKAELPLSMAASVPEGLKLRVKFFGPLPRYIGDGVAPWTYQVAPTNWIGQAFLDEGMGDRPQQTFDAVEGVADMQLTFFRTGKVHIAVYQGDARTPTWTKDLHVID